MTVMSRPLRELDRPRRLPTRARVLVFGVQYSIIFCLFVMAMAYTVSTPQSTILITPLCVVFTIVAIWSLWSWRYLMGTVFDPYIMFLVAAILFNGGTLILRTLSFVDSGIFTKFSDDTVVQTIFLVISGIVAFHTGALIGTLSPQIDRKKTDLIATRDIAGRRLRIMGWFLVAISLVPAFLVLRHAVSLVLSGGYFSLYQQEDATGLRAGPQVLATFIVTGTLFMLVGGKTSRTCKIVSLLLIIGYSMVQYFLGARATATMPLIAYAWAWHRSVRRLPMTALAMAGFVMLFVIFPLVGLIRTGNAQDRASGLRTIDTFLTTKNPAVAVLDEMGSTIETVAYTLQLVPNKRPFDWGEGYAYATTTVLPNLFWNVHPAISHGLASHWLISQVDPTRAARGGGIGYSFIAEAYFNFGWLGGQLVLCCMGWGFGLYTCRFGYAKSDTKTALTAAFMAFFLVFARSESGNIVRLISWYVLAPSFLLQVIPMGRGEHLIRSTRTVRSRRGS